MSRRITRSSQTVHGILFLKYWNASSREGQTSRREDVAATAKSMADMRSSSSELNTSRVTIVASIRTMAANVEGGISLVVSILRQVALVAKRRREKKEWNCGTDRKLREAVKHHGWSLPNDNQGTKLIRTSQLRQQNAPKVRSGVPAFEMSG